MKRLLKSIGRTVAKVVNRIKAKDTPRQILISYWAVESIYSIGVILAFLVAGMYIQAAMAICMQTILTYAVTGVVRTEI